MGSGEMRVEKKTFYAMHREDGLLGVRKHEGFGIEARGMKLNAYMNKYGIVHMVDPQTGMSIYQYTPEVCGVEDDCAVARLAGEKLSGNWPILDKWTDRQRTEEYGILEQAFESFRHGAGLMEEWMRREEKRDIGRLRRAALGNL